MTTGVREVERSQAQGQSPATLCKEADLGTIETISTQNEGLDIGATDADAADDGENDILGGRNDRRTDGRS